MEMFSAMLLHPRNTARPVDSRWRRILDLADRGGRARHKHDDVWVRRGLAYLKRLRCCKNDAARGRLAAKEPDLDAAYKLYSSEDKVARGLLEGRILAGQSFAEIAAACGLAEGAVETYHAIFFDMAGRLDSRVFIMLAALGKPISHVEADEIDIVIKYLGVRCGPLALDMLQWYFEGRWTVPATLCGHSKGELKRLVYVLYARVMVLALTTPFQRLHRVVLLKDLVNELDDLVAQLSDAPASSNWEPTQEQQRWWRAVAVALAVGDDEPVRPAA